MKKVLIIPIFSLMLSLPFAHTTHGFPSVHQLKTLFQAIRGGNRQAITLFNELFQNDCPTRLLNFLYALAMTSNQRDLVDFFHNDNAATAADYMITLNALAHYTQRPTTDEEIINELLVNEPQNNETQNPE